MFKLKKLPYGFKDLEPMMSEDLLTLHYKKHHQAYCDNFNIAIKNEEKINEKSIEEIFSEISKYGRAVSNHGGGYFNHEFFWDSMCKTNSKENDISKNMLFEIEKKFGSFDNFKDEFENEAMSVFGSGWAWLGKNENGELVIFKTWNQESPEMDFMIKRNGVIEPLLNLDVWEHAYYPDYKNLRGDFVKSFWKVINWKKIEERFLEHH